MPAKALQYGARFSIRFKECRFGARSIESWSALALSHTGFLSHPIRGPSALLVNPHDTPFWVTSRINWPQNWPEDLRPACLPDPSTVSRRRHGPEVQKTAYALHERSVDHLGAVSGYAGLGAPEAPCFPMDMGQKPAPSCVAPHETQSRLMQFVVKATAQQRAAARIYDRSTQTAPVDYHFLLRQAFNVERSPLT